MRLLLTRPADDAEPLARLLEARGVETLVEPLLSIRYFDGPPPDLAGVQAVLATSANGVRAFARRTDSRDVPVLAVGEATAKVALGAGFRAVESAGGDVRALALLAKRRFDPTRGALLHVAGSDVAGDLAGLLEQAGFACRRVVLYEARQADRLSAEAAAAIGGGTLDGVLLFSPRTAEAFVRLARGAGLADACGRLAAFCLSPAVAAAAAELGWAAVRVAPRPEQSELVDTVEAWRREAAAG
jgi:uroporphyrinogen-III synthase